MISPRKSLIISLLTVIVITTFITTIGITFLIEKEKIFGKVNIDILSLIFRTSFSLVGGLISGLVAFTIFDLNNKQDIAEKYETSKKGFAFINTEMQDNRKAADELLEIFNTASVNVINDMLTKDETRESFLIAKTNFTTELIDKTLPNLNEEHYFAVVQEISILKKIITTLQLITSEVSNSENNLALLKKLKTLLTTFRKFPEPREIDFNKQYVMERPDDITNYLITSFLRFYFILCLVYFIYIIL